MTMSFDSASVIDARRGRRPGKIATPSIEVVQYGDFQCRDCGRAAITLASFRERFQDRIVFCYRHFPSAGHPHSVHAAEASECARSQGRFWKMHDLLFANQDRLGLQYIYDYAERAGLDMKRFDSEMDDETHLQTIQMHRADAISMGIRRTPAFAVNGTPVDGSRAISALFAATERALADAAPALHAAAPIARSDQPTL